MMVKRFLDSLSIRSKILSITALPLILVSGLIGFYNIAAHIETIELDFAKRSSELATGIGEHCEYGVFSGDIAMLENIVMYHLRDPEIVAIRILDAEHHPMVDSRRLDQGRLDPLPATAREIDSGLRKIFTAPITKRGINFSDYETSPDPTSIRVMGWVELDMTLSVLKEVERKAVVNSLLIVLAGLVLTLSLAFILIGTITNPISALQGAVRRLRGGDYAIRIPQTHGGELGDLESGINDMAEAMQLSQRRLQHQYDAAKTELSVLLEALPVTLYRARVGDQFQFVFLTPNIEILTGFPPERFIEEPAFWYDRIVEEDRARVLSIMDDIHHHKAMELEYQWTVADGSRRNFFNYLRLIEKPDGGIPEILGAWLDITDQKSVAEALRSTVQMLKEKNLELEDARTKAMQAGEAKAAFLANMSHEIRTPLNAIIGYASQLYKTGLTPDQHEYLHTIYIASSQLLHILDDILHFSRLESGKYQLESIPFRLRDCLENAVCMLSRAAHERNLELALLIDADVPNNLIGDPIRVSQVLTNLVNNAIKFTSAGYIHVKVETLFRKGDMAQIRVRVEDSGIGIDPEVQATIFEEFQQADNTITRKFGGAGLGLAIVSRLVRLMGGSVGVESEPGAGSTFWFTLTLPIDPDHPDMDDGHDLTGTKVLLFENNHLTRRAIRNQLLLWKADVFVVNDIDDISKPLTFKHEQGAEMDIVILGLEKSDTPFLEKNISIVRNQCGCPILILVDKEKESVALPEEGYGRVAVASKPIRKEVLFREITQILDEAAVSEPQETNEAPTRHHGLRVMAAEDNAPSRSLLEHLYRDDGFDVTTVANGSDALRYLDQHPVDIIVLDVHLPGMDGIEVAKRLRQGQGPNKYTPIITLTADAFLDYEQTLLPAGIDICILKPFSDDQLLAVSRRLAAQVRDRESLSKSRKFVVVPAAAPERRAVDGGTVMGLQMRAIAELPEHIDRLRASLAQGDLETYRADLHRLKGMAQVFGMERLAAVIGERESMLRGVPNGAPVDMVSLRVFTDNVAREADQYRSTVPAAAHPPDGRPPHDGEQGEKDGE